MYWRLNISGQINISQDYAIFIYVPAFSEPLMQDAIRSLSQAKYFKDSTMYVY